MKKFLKKTIVFLLIGLLPVFPLLAIYFICDPFKVIYTYPSYYISGAPEYIELNRDYVSTETFIQKYPTYKYNSFIFGNSRSFFYETADWKKHISEGRCFHFNASRETIYGIYKKIAFLDKNNIQIKNALIILDYGLLSVITNSKGHLYIKHPVLSGDFFSFHMEFIKAFLNPSFLIKYLPLKFFNIVSSSFKYYTWDYDSITNEFKWTYLEKEILKNPNKYYLSKINLFYKRVPLQQYSPIIIKDEQISMLSEILKIFKKNNTNYKIIISPLYNQIKLNSADLSTLKLIFGNEHVFDFSGINSITNNMYNYYETSHYRPQVSREILNEIYKNE
jgi:hypothetical protein